jgi:hypothetical protein
MNKLLQHASSPGCRTTHPDVGQHRDEKAGVSSYLEASVHGAAPTPTSNKRATNFSNTHADNVVRWENDSKMYPKLSRILHPQPTRGVGVHRGQSPRQIADARARGASGPQPDRLKPVLKPHYQLVLSTDGSCTHPHLLLMHRLTPSLRAAAPVCACRLRCWP